MSIIYDIITGSGYCIAIVLFGHIVICKQIIGERKP